jgi:GNAT superfamily N-acetyltransferase
VERSVRAGETRIAEVDGEPTGTITVNDRADKGLWSRGEIADAVIVHYMIVDLRFTGHRVGAALLAHAAAVHAYYHRAGFHLARIAGTEAPGPSGALFERRADNWLPPAPVCIHVVQVTVK